MYAESPDAVFVLAAGNRTQSKPDYPAGFAVGFGIVAGAINIDGKRWAPTNGTNTLAPQNYLLAPGVDVPTDTLVGDSNDNHNTADASGTSIAAAHISGVIALMLDANPALTPREVESILIASADQVIKQTVAASAPSIGSTLYFAGESVNVGQPGALLADTAASSSGTHSTSKVETQVVTPIQAPSTAPTTIVTSSSRATDEVFAHLAEAREQELLDLITEQSIGDALCS
jgi:subtilisin family serine protease